MIEIYNPNRWLTWGGMGSKKLAGDNIVYIENSDSHPGAQFSSEFRNLAKSEIAKFTAEDRLETAQAATPLELALLMRPTMLKPAEPAPADQPADTVQQGDVAAEGKRPVAQGEILNLPKRAEPERVAQQPPQP
jgi:hypothetical protein